jgi:hypothetical protein
MPLTLLLAAAAALLAAGYALGRLRPWARLAAWADWQMYAGRWWHATRLRQEVLTVLFAVTWPRIAWSAWRHRNDPPLAIPFDSPFLKPAKEDNPS